MVVVCVYVMIIVCGILSAKIYFTLKSRPFLDIAEGRRVNNVADSESLDGLVLGDAATAVEAADVLGMTTPLLGTTSVSSLESHLCVLRLNAFFKFKKKIIYIAIV